LIRESRDVEFWTHVYEHPEVRPHVSFGHELDIASVVEHASVLPLRAEHGGFLFCRLDGLGRVYELHTLFTPEGWGREVHLAAKQAFCRVFETGAQLVTTYEVEGNPRSRPPRTFRFEPAGDFAPAENLPPLRTWVLTRNAWEASPAHRSM